MLTFPIDSSNIRVQGGTKQNRKGQSLKKLIDCELEKAVVCPEMCPLKTEQLPGKKATQAENASCKRACYAHMSIIISYAR